MSDLALRCPECGAELVIRAQRATGQEFLGCARYPRCKYSEPLPPTLEMRRAGAQPLPGLE